MEQLILRQAAIDALSELATFTDECSEHTWMYTDDVYKAIKQLPPVQPELIYCKDCKKQNKDYHMSPYKDTVCPLTAWRGTAQGHEYDYQFCCFAERREVTA